MKETKIIAIAGKAQSGKDTTCEYLQYYLGNKYPNEFAPKRYYFAKALKDFCVNVLNLKWEGVHGSDSDKTQLSHLKWNNLPLDISTREFLKKNCNAIDAEYMTNREVMEVFGSYICRRMYPDCWALATKNEIAASTHKHLALITDARFPNEIDLLNGRNFHIIHLTRNPLNRNVISETALDSYDFPKERYYRIDNGGMTIDEKNKHLNSIIEAIIKE